jgi:6-pyruvoyltetrahydropterin/6-carboxytetrahydropterin synthase
MTRPTVTLTRIYHFSAGHRLESPELSAEDNLRVYGPCHRPHGHNYYLEVTVTGSPDPVTGMAADLGLLDRTVTATVLDRVDHQDLSTAVPELAGVITTGESLARAFWEMLAPRVPALTRVGVIETAKNRFDYWGGGAGPR